MIKRLLIFFCLLLVGTLCQNTVNYYAFVNCVNGTDMKGNFSQNVLTAPTWKTLNFAIESASIFATNKSSINVVIYVYAGNYGAHNTIKNLNIKIISVTAEFYNKTEPDVYINPYMNRVLTFLVAENCSLTIIGIKFNNFVSVGAINAKDMKNVLIKICEFTNSSGILITNSFLIEIENNVFHNNMAWYMGGCIYLDKCEAIFIKTNYFVNSASLSADGGAIYISKSQHSMILNNIFIDCVANIDGGAIFLDSRRAIIENNIFSDNFAIQNGGAIYATASTLNIIVKNNNFTGNTAQVGGAVYINFNIQNVDMISNYYFENNATLAGGAIYNEGSYLTINNSIFLQNHCESIGGAIYISWGTYKQKIYYSEFKLNTAYYAGGAIYTHYNAEIVSTNFYKNQALLGGAINSVNANPLVVDKVKFEMNIANNGTAIYSLDNFIKGILKLHITNVNITDKNLIYCQGKCIIKYT